MNKIILVLRNEKKSRTSRYVNLMISFRGTGLMKIGFFFFFLAVFIIPCEDRCETKNSSSRSFRFINVVNPRPRI